MGMDQDDHSAECIVSCVKDDWPFVCPKQVQQSRNFWVVSWRWSDDPRLGREHLHRPCFVAHGFRLETPNQIFFFSGGGSTCFPPPFVVRVANHPWEVSKATEVNDCPKDWKIFSPRSKEDWETIISLDVIKDWVVKSSENCYLIHINM